MKPPRNHMCIHEPNDWCVDCNPNCPNSEEQEPITEIPTQDLVELELCLKKGGLKP